MHSVGKKRSCSVHRSQRGRQREAPLWKKRGSAAEEKGWQAFAGMWGRLEKGAAGVHALQVRHKVAPGGFGQQGKKGKRSRAESGGAGGCKMRRIVV